MSLVLTSLLVATGVMAGRWIALRARGGEGNVTPPGTDENPVEKKMTATHDARLFAAFPCSLGDVVIGLGGDEAWLAGAIVFYEETPAAALFIAPDAGGDRAVFVRSRPSQDLLWLKPVAGASLDVGNEPPSSLEHENERFERVRRLPLRAEPHGAGAPDVGEQVVVVEYRSMTGARLLLVTRASGGKALAWSGILLEPGMYDVLASGTSTLEES